MYSLLQLIIASTCKKEKSTGTIIFCVFQGQTEQTSSSIVSLSDCFGQVYMGCETRKMKVAMEMICGNYINFRRCKTNKGNR